MLIKDNSKLIRAEAAAVEYTGADPVYLTRVNQPLVDKIISYKRTLDDEAAARFVRAA